MSKDSSSYESHLFYIHDCFISLTIATKVTGKIRFCSCVLVLCVYTFTNGGKIDVAAYDSKDGMTSSRKGQFLRNQTRTLHGLWIM